MLEIDSAIDTWMDYKRVFSKSKLRNSDLIKRGISWNKIIQMYKDAIKSKTEINLSQL